MKLVGQNDGGSQEGEITGYSNVLVTIAQSYEPLVGILGAQLALDEVVTIGLLLGLYEEHHVVAVRSFHDANIAVLAALIEAPVFETGFHLAGVDVLIQTAFVSVVLSLYVVEKCSKS